MKKSRPTIWVHTLCVNEENFIWFALMSVVGYVDKILVWDTGSTDKTVELIKDVKSRFPNKIEFRERGVADAGGVTRLRQEMLDESDCDWILIVDGDEVWWEDSIKRLVKYIELNKNNFAAVVVPYKVPVGDIYHFQDSSAGRYRIAGKVGHISVRAINRKIPGLHVKNEYPLEGYLDKNGNLIQDRKDVVFFDAQYLHLTHLARSSRSRIRNTYKLELGKYVGKNYRFPEAFYIPRPNIVPDPWVSLNAIDSVIAWGMTLIRMLKRRLY